MQPFILVTGPSLNNIVNYFVVLNDIFYDLTEAKLPGLKALDICFKLFHALNIEYPEESYHIWLLIQKFVYKIGTAFDRTIPQIESIVSDLQKSES